MSAPTEQEVFEYLDELRESGGMNMYGAAPFVEEAFDVDRKVAIDYLLKWMRTFAKRHPR